LVRFSMRQSLFFIGLATASAAILQAGPAALHPTATSAITLTTDSDNVASVAVAQLVGAVLFSCGSAFFVWAAWAEEWLQPLRIGCAFWVAGAMPYLWPPLRNECLQVKGTHVSNTLQVGGMLSWAIGSAFAFHHDTDAGLPVTNGGFLLGSLCLLVDALLQVDTALSATPVARDEKASLRADVIAGVLYLLAGAFGGYATEVWLLQFGNCCWLAGSLISGTRPCLALSALTRRGPAGRTCNNAAVEAEAKADCTTTSAA